MKSIFGSPEPGDSIAAQPEHQMSVVLGAESREMPWNTYYIYPTIGIIHPKTPVVLIWIMCIGRACSGSLWQGCRCA